MDPPAAGQARGPLTLGLVLTVSVTAFEALAVATILPGTVREIGGLELYGWAFTAFLLANLVAIPIAGRAADRGGAAAPFLAGVVLFAAGLAVAGLAPTMSWLVAGRALQGAGAAAVSSVAYVAVARAYPPAAQPRVMALFASAWVVPGLIGPAIAAALARQFGWRWVFLGLIGPTLGAGALTLTGLRRLAAQAAPPTGGGGIGEGIALALGVAILLLAGRIGGGATTSLLVALFGAALAGWALRRLFAPGRVGARVGLAPAIAAMALVQLAFFAVEAFLPLALTDVRGAGSGLVAAALTAGTLAWSAGSWLQERIAPGAPRRRLLRLGLILLAVGVGGAAAALLSAVPVVIAVLAWAVAGLGIGVVYPLATLAILDRAPGGREGEVTALMQIANSLAIAVGTGAGGELLRRALQGGRPAALGIAAIDAGALGAALLALVAGWRLALPGAKAPANPAG